MEDELQRCAGLLREFGELNHSRRDSPTFTEVAGIGTKEVAVSNILAFLIDPTAAHGFGKLWFRSLVKTAGQMGDQAAYEYRNDCVRHVERERVTAKGNRIDLVVHGEGVVVGIENKVLADLYNDLEDYAAAIDNDAFNEGSEPVRLVLSLNDLSDVAAPSGFTSVTYRGLFERVRENMAGVECPSGPWLVFVDDFMSTIERLETRVDGSASGFIREHWDDASRFLEVVQKYRAEQLGLCQTIAALLDERGEIEGASWAKQWPEFLGAIVVHDSVPLDSHPLAVRDRRLCVSTEAWACEEGWRIWCWIRGNRGASSVLWAKVDEIARGEGQSMLDRADGTLQMLPPDAAAEEVAAAVERWAKVADMAMEALGSRT